jgi:hypothetical protein
MKLFKFIGSNPFPDVYYFSETVAFSDSFDYEIIYRAHFIEYIGFHSIGGSIYNYLLTETLALLDKFGLTEFLEEILGLNDLEERWGWGYFDEILNLQDTTSQRMVYSISLNEGIGFVESGTYNLALVDYKVTWRARTRVPGVGYGKAGYGIEHDYGDGDCSDLGMFIVRVYNALTNSLRRTVFIPIVDTLNPDDDAEYIYTSAFNIADNTTFQPNIRFEITQVDNSDSSIDVAPHNMVVYNTYPCVVTESSYYTSSYRGWKCFDSSTLFGSGHYWVASISTGWVKIDLGVDNAKLISSYSLVSNSIPEPNRQPRNWTLYGSNDDSIWYELDSVTDQISWGSGEKRDFVCDVADTAYRYFRINVTLNNGDARVSIAEIYLYIEAGVESPVAYIDIEPMPI